MYDVFHLFAGKAFAPEFYYDTYSPLWQNRPRVYGYKLQWTQMNPNAVDRIMAYRLGIRQVKLYFIEIMPLLTLFFIYDTKVLLNACKRCAFLS